MYEDLKNYNVTLDRCFSECIFSLASKDLTKDENKCLGTCFKKTIRYNERFALATSIARTNIQ
jgi:hypothetical protein